MSALLLASTLQILGMGIDVANRAMSFMANVRLGNCDRQAAIRDVVCSSEESIKETIAVNADLIIDKIERDKFDELLSRIKNVGMLIELSRPQEMMQYMLLLNESVDYADQRLRENKEHWIGPFLMGKSMCLAVLTYYGHNTDDVAEEITKTIDEFKYKLLTRSLAIQANSRYEIPWHLYKRVLDNDAGGLADFATYVRSHAAERDNLLAGAAPKIFGKNIESPDTDSKKQSVMFCRRCGNKINADGVFCNRCGARIS